MDIHKENLLLNELKKTTTKKELIYFIENNKEIEKNPSLSNHVVDFMKNKNLKKIELIRKTGINRTYAYQILQGTRKPSRDKLISLCICLGMDLCNVQNVLTIASLGILHCRKRRDVIIIFSINQKLSVIQTNEILYEMGENILK